MPVLTARAVVFDLDGTLVDSFAGIALSLNHARAALGHPDLTLEEVRGLVGWGLDELLARAFPAPEQEPARQLYREHHERTCVASTRVFDGVKETLASLQAKGIRLGVATNKPSRFARLVLDGLGLTGFFASIVGSDQVARAKPHPEMLLRVLGELGVAPAEAIYVGDMHLDVETGRAAGVLVIAVASGAQGEAELTAAGASQVIGCFADLVERIVPGLSAAQAPMLQ